MRCAGAPIWKQGNRPGGENSACELMRIAGCALGYPKVGPGGRAEGCICKMQANPSLLLPANHKIIMLLCGSSFRM